LSYLLLGHEMLGGLDVLGDGWSCGFLCFLWTRLLHSLLHLPLLLPDELCLLDDLILPLDVAVGLSQLDH